MPTFEPDLRDVFDATSRAVVFGDIHGDATALRLVASRAVGEMQLTRVLVSVGDLGLGTWGGHQDKLLNRADYLLEELDGYLLVVPGNHDDYDWIDSTLASRRDALGFGVGGRHGRVRIASRGHRWTLGGRRFGALGGAVSLDRARRTEGRSWWAAEAPTPADAETLGDGELDVLITHDVPAGVPMVSAPGWNAQLLERSDVVRALLREAVEATRPAVGFCGHWHQRVTHTLERADGGTTRVEALSAEHTPGNAVVLDLRDTALPVRPLPEAYRAYLAGGDV